MASGNELARPMPAPLPARGDHLPTRPRTHFCPAGNPHPTLSFTLNQGLQAPGTGQVVVI